MGSFGGSEGVPGWRVGAAGIEDFFLSKLERLPGGGGAAGIENSSKNERGYQGRRRGYAAGRVRGARGARGGSAAECDRARRAGPPSQQLQATSPVGQQLLVTVPGGSRAARPCTTRDSLESKNNFQVRPHTSQLFITGSAGTAWNPKTISRYGHTPKNHLLQVPPVRPGIQK